MPENREHFLETLWEHYARHGRHELPWRLAEPDGTFSPYKVVVSELMLQQTQVMRVLPKYQEFLGRFPSIETLAAAELGEVLRAWSGLGYNRRAKFLHQAVRTIVYDLHGHFPQDQTELIELPGIGKNTAGAILAYAFNQPALFIETNIRTVYLYHFFPGREEVHDSDILELLHKTLDHDHPREFYWALMDYGSFLKQTIGNLNVASKHYAKQSTFHGSRRQVRGQVLKMLGGSTKTLRELQGIITDERLPAVLEQLQQEGMIQKKGMRYYL